MTREEVLALPAGVELDALVATHLFGLDLSARPEHDWGEDEDIADIHSGKTCRRCGEICWTCGCSDRNAFIEKTCVGSALPYSIGTGWAWSVIEKVCGPHSFICEVGYCGWGDCSVCFRVPHAGQVVAEAQADTFPLAACRAAVLLALQAKGELKS